MRYVALLRGINVGGNNMIKMETLRATFESLGFENVKSYINSGNLAFDTSKTDDQKLAKKIHDAIQKDFGFDISVMVRSIAEIEDIIANNPYVGQFDNDKDVHVFFLDSEPTAEQNNQLQGNTNENEFITITGRTIYYMLRISILDSALGKGFLDRKLKIVNTARNWRTVNRIAEL
jgi:uncharacterized protein (DUF1697 family)